MLKKGKRQKGKKKEKRKGKQQKSCMPTRSTVSDHLTPMFAWERVSHEMLASTKLFKNILTLSSVYFH